MQKSGSERRTGTYHVELAPLRGGEIDFVAFWVGGIDNKGLARGRFLVGNSFVITGKGQEMLLVKDFIAR